MGVSRNCKKICDEFIRVTSAWFWRVEIYHGKSASKIGALHRVSWKMPLSCIMGNVGQHRLCCINIVYHQVCGNAAEKLERTFYVGLRSDIINDQIWICTPSVLRIYDTCTRMSTLKLFVIHAESSWSGLIWIRSVKRVSQKPLLYFMGWVVQYYIYVSWVWFKNMPRNTTLFFSIFIFIWMPGGITTHWLDTLNQTPAVCVVNGRGAVHHLLCSLGSAQTVRDSHGEVESGLFSLLFLKSLQLATMTLSAVTCVAPNGQCTRKQRGDFHRLSKCHFFFSLPQLWDWDCGSREDMCHRFAGSKSIRKLMWDSLCVLWR